MKGEFYSSRSFRAIQTTGSLTKPEAVNSRTAGVILPKTNQTTSDTMNKSTSDNQPQSLVSYLGSNKTIQTIVLASIAGLASLGNAANATNTAPAKAEKPPPLPLHQIEGNGGIFSTLSAYLVNPPRNGEPVGRPSLGFAYVNVGQGRNLEALTITETPWKRLELGYGWDRFDLGDLPQAVQNATGISIRNKDVTLHNFNARLQLLKENEFEQKWIPALTLGTHYKLNNGYKQINSDLFGTLSNYGIKRDSGVDFTLYGGKLLTFLPRPLLLEAGVRATKGAQIGLLGFTDNYSFVAEANAVLFLTDRLALAAEYRQKPSDYRPIGNLVKGEDDWWTIDAAYVVSKHFTVAAGYGHFGDVLNHQANGVWGLTFKFEF
jgi:hypothetical protein